jgi:hypothetical protein
MPKPDQQDEPDFLKIWKKLLMLKEKKI